jgi:hypothetical protein
MEYEPYELKQERSNEAFRQQLHHPIEIEPQRVVVLITTMTPQGREEGLVTMKRKGRLAGTTKHNTNMVL